MSKERLYHPENRTLYTEIESNIITAGLTKGYQLFPHRYIRRVTFMADHQTDENLEFYVEYTTDSLRNPVPAPEFRLPAFQIRKDPGLIFRTKFGKLPQFVVDTTETEYLLSTQYFLNGRGQGIRCETIERYDNEPETIVEARQRWIEEGIPRLDYPISKNDSRKLPLDDEDREYIRDLLQRFKAGEFEMGEYQIG